MPKFKNDPVVSVSNSINTPAVQGEGRRNEGVRGVSHNGHGGGVGINDWSPSIASPGAEGREGRLLAGLGTIPRHDSTVEPVISAGGFGVYGQSDNGIGVVGESTSNEGVRGVSHNPHGGVVGINDSPPPGGNGGWFESNHGEGVRGWSRNPDHGGVVGVNTAKGIAVYGTSDDGVGIHGRGGRLAGFFEGDVEVTGDIRLGNADCAEDFNIGGDVTVEPGTVMVLGEDGALFPSQRAYDKCVAGVISGAGDYKPGIVLDKQPSESNRQPIALLGKVYCKVDAQFGPIEVGDLLTTSPTPGYAMRVDDPLKAFGAVIGKALRPLAGDQGLIPILIALQ